MDSLHSIPPTRLSPRQATEQLQCVLQDVETFLGQWVDQVRDDIAGTHNAATPTAILRKRIADFQEEKSQWEAKRNRELQEIEDKARELTEAWLRLESEQRTSKVGEATAKPTAASRPAPIAASADETDAAQSAQRPARIGQQTRQRRISRANKPSEAVIQFEQLRREIESTRGK